MVNQEIFGGLISALSRGETLQKAMISLYNAGYSKKEIQESATLLKSQTPEQIMQKSVQDKKQKFLKKTQKKKIEEKQKTIKLTENLSPEKKPRHFQSGIHSQRVSKYGQKPAPEFKTVIDQTIRNLRDLKSPIQVVKPDADFKPPIIIQRVSDYNSQKPKKASKIIVVILFALLIILLGSLIALFIFRNQLIEIFNNFGF